MDHLIGAKCGHRENSEDLCLYRTGGEVSVTNEKEQCLSGVSSEQSSAVLTGVRHTHNGKENSRQTNKTGYGFLKYGN